MNHRLRPDGDVVNAQVQAPLYAHRLLGHELNTMPPPLHGNLHIKNKVFSTQSRIFPVFFQFYHICV